MVVRWVIKVIVYTDNEGCVFTGRRCRDQNLLCAGFDVLSCTLSVGKTTGRLDNDVYAEVSPTEVCRVALCKHLDDVAANDDVLAFNADFLVQATGN